MRQLIIRDRKQCICIRHSTHVLCPGLGLWQYKQKNFEFCVVCIKNSAMLSIMGEQRDPIGCG